MRLLPLLLALVMLAGNVMAQEPEHMADAAVKAETVVPDAGPTGTDQQVKENTARIEVQEKMSGNQDFILKLLGIFAPIVVFGMQLRQNAKLNAVAKSVNGMKDELVEEVRKAALLQGAKTERQAHTKRATKRKPKA